MESKRLFGIKHFSLGWNLPLVLGDISTVSILTLTYLLTDLTNGHTNKQIRTIKDSNRHANGNYCTRYAIYEIKIRYLNFMQ